MNKLKIPHPKAGDFFTYRLRLALAVALAEFTSSGGDEEGGVSENIANCKVD